MLAAGLAGAAHAEQAGPLEVPSGLALGHLETIEEPASAASGGLPLVRVRFLAPALADGTTSYPDVAEDFPALCAGWALPWAEKAGHAEARAVISMSDRMLPFGATDPEAVQFFEAYRIRDGRCDLEPF
jgi:hypothetical protein